jgi:hypothetical protein
MKTSRSTGERSFSAAGRPIGLPAAPQGEGGGAVPPVVGVVVAAAGSCENTVAVDMTEPAGTEGTHPFFLAQPMCSIDRP